MSVRFDFEWEDAPGVTDAATARAWARLQVTVQGVCVTQVLDERTQAVRGAVHVSMLPIAEWIVAAWPRLIHERTVVTERAPAWAEWKGYHDLVAARAGAALPSLTITRQSPGFFHVMGVESSLQGAAQLPGITVRFLNGAEAQVPAEHLKREFARVVDAVIARLSDQAAGEAAQLLKAWSAARSGFARLAGRLGQDPTELSPADADAIRELQAHTKLDEVLSLAEAIDAASVRARLVDAKRIADALPQLAVATQPWTAMEQTVAARRMGLPWETGWAATGAFRRATGLAENHVPGKQLGAILDERCGWPVSGQVVPVPAVASMFGSIFRGADGRLPQVMAARGPGTRFRVAQALYLGLFSHRGAGGFCMPEVPVTAQQRREARAFAAELLAPAAWLEENAPPSRNWNRTLVARLAQEAHVPPRLVEHQVANRHLGVLDVA